MNKYCIWNGILFRYKYKKKYKNEFDSWETYCGVNRILRNTHHITLKKIKNCYYINNLYYTSSFWKNYNTDDIIEFEAKTDKEALLKFREEVST